VHQEASTSTRSRPGSCCISRASVSPHVGDHLISGQGKTARATQRKPQLQVSGRGRRSVGSDDGHNQNKKHQMEGQKYQRWVEQAGHWRSVRRDQIKVVKPRARSDGSSRVIVRHESCGWPLMSIGMGQEPPLGWTLVVKKRFRCARSRSLRMSAGRALSAEPLTNSDPGGDGEFPPGSLLRRM
jgi:hypothetical protein